MSHLLRLAEFGVWAEYAAHAYLFRPYIYTRLSRYPGSIIVEMQEFHHKKTMDPRRGHPDGQKPLK
jgi:hypothetical protein